MAIPRNDGNKKTAPSGYSYDELARSIKNDEIRSLYLFYGEEEFLIAQILRAVKNQVIAPGMQEADFNTVDGSSTKLDPERIKEIVGTPPFLSRKRLAVIRNSGLFGPASPESSDISSAFVRVFETIPEFSTLIFVESKVDKRKKVLFDAVSKNGIPVQFAKRTPDELSRWIAFLLKKHDIRIKVDAIGSLIDRTEGSMRILDSEVKKLILYCEGNRLHEVGTEDIEAVCIPDLRGSVFQMTDAIGARDVNRALTVLDTLISLKEPITRIRFMFARHIRQLICAKELGRQEAILSTLKVVPFVARNLSGQAKSFTMDELLSLYEACAASDFSVKTGKIDERLSMELLLAEAAKSRDRKTALS